MLKNNSVFPIQGDPYRRNGVWISGSLLALKLTPEVYDLVPHLLCDRHKQKSKNAGQPPVYQLIQDYFSEGLEWLLSQLSPLSHLVHPIAFPPMRVLKYFLAT